MSPAAEADSAPPLGQVARGLLVPFRLPLYVNALVLWADAAASSALGLGFWLLAARLYRADEVGIASAAVSALSLIAVFGHVGLGQGLIRFLPLCPERRNEMVSAALVATALVSLAVGAAFLLGAPVWARRCGRPAWRSFATTPFISSPS